MGHARALLTLEDPKTQIRIFNETVSQGYSVRKVEEIVKALSNGESVKSGGKTITPKSTQLSEEYSILQNHLCSFFGTKVQLSCTNKGKGKISIPFNSEADLERIMEILDSLKKQNKQKAELKPHIFTYILSFVLLLCMSLLNCTEAHAQRAKKHREGVLTADSIRTKIRQTVWL